MEASYRRAYERLYREHWWWRAREEFVVEILRERQPPNGWGLILDVGCGNGLFFERLREFGEVEGVEPSAELVGGGSRQRGKIHVGPFDEKFRPGKQYSLILMLDVLEHLDAAAEALRHALRLLGPEGLTVITVPAFPVLWTNHDILNEHRTRFTKKSFSRVAAQAGLRVLQMRYFFHWMFPAKLAARAMEAMWHSTPKVPDIPRGWINRAAFELSRAEQRLFRASPLPFGNSLLVIGSHAQDPAGGAPLTGG